jgi:hypothetical protein
VHVAWNGHYTIGKKAALRLFLPSLPPFAFFPSSALSTNQEGDTRELFLRARGKKKVVLCFSPSLFFSTTAMEKKKEGRRRTPLSWEYDLREFQRYPFSELFSSAGESLHTPWRMPTFMATVLLSQESNVLSGL